MKKFIQNLSLLTACATALTISGCAGSDSAATAGQRQSTNNTGAGVGGTGAGGTGVGGPGIGGPGIGRGDAGGSGTGGVYGGGR